MAEKDTFNLYKGDGTSLGDRGLSLKPFKVDPGEEDPRNYIATQGLKDAVNVALALGQPLLVTGEPGTGKTRLGASIAHELDLLPPLEFHTKTTSLAQDLFYEYDAILRFQDAHSPEKKSTGIYDYISFKALGISTLLSMPAQEGDPYLPEKYKGKGPARSVVLIDEIDKAPRDLPNDLLNEIENMEFTVKETGEKFQADRARRPIILITSNSEKNLPEAFLRRCVYYHIPFPNEKQLLAIMEKRFGKDNGFSPEFLSALVRHFQSIRDLDLKKSPATAEFLAWAKIIQTMKIEDLDNLTPREKDMLTVSYSILAKSNEDLKRLKQNL